MKHPTKESVLKAAKESKEIKKALQILFPNYFESVQLGDIFEWGIEGDEKYVGFTGIIVQSQSEAFQTLINFLTGEIILPPIHKNISQSEFYGKLELELKKIVNFRGPLKLASWTTKNRA